MFNFKKIIGALVLTVVLTQAFTVFPVHAQEKDNTCWHQECGNYNASDDGYACSTCTEFNDGKVYTSNNNGMSHSYVFTCQGCSYTDSGNNETCVIENGACRACGQTKADSICAHQNCSKTAESLSICSDCINSDIKNTCVKVDDNVHDYVGICNSCESETGDNTRGIPHWDNGGGYCICGHEVNSSSGSTQCSHIQCENYNAGASAGEYCSACSYSASYISSFDSETHTYGLRCNGCKIIREDLGTLTEAHNFYTVEDGYTYCVGCGYSISKPSGKPPIDKTGNTPVYVPTQEEIYAQKAAEIEARQQKTVTTATGETIKTEIAGVYEVNNLSGTAVNTPKAEVQKAIGLTDEEIAAGTNASIYMSDYVTKEDREALNEAAANNGKNVLSMVVSDMYSITKDGKITKLNSSKEPISLMFGLPKHAIDMNRTYSVLCITADGKVVELKDTDKDASTITVDTTVFGKYVIVY